MTGVPEPIVDGMGALIRGSRGTELSALSDSDLLALFRDRNLLLFRGFEVGMERFMALTERLSSSFMTYAGGAFTRERVGDDPTMMTVTAPTQHYPVPLHGEMYYLERRPKILWFHCVRPVKKGGETTFGDGTWIHDNLSDGTRRLFHEKRIRYVIAHPEGLWQEIFQTKDLEEVRRQCEGMRYSMRVDERDGSVITEYLSKAIWETLHGGAASFINNIFAMTRWEQAGIETRKVRLEDGSPLPRDVIDELWDVEKQATRDVRWEPGDILMVDNTRFLHGRRAFEDSGREIYVRLAMEEVS